LLVVNAVSVGLEVGSRILADGLLSEQARFWVDAHRQVRESFVPNYKFCRIPVRSGLVIPRWRYWLACIDSPDSDLVDLLEFGWPLGYTSDQVPVSCNKNHSGALTFDEATD